MLRRSLLTGGSLLVFGAFGVLSYRCLRKSAAAIENNPQPDLTVQTLNNEVPQFPVIDAAENIRMYFERHYGVCNLLKEEIELLTFFFNNSWSTPESSTRIVQNPDDMIDPEIKRALARRQCLYLFIEGTARGHETFTRAQPNDDKLTWDSFQFFSNLIKKVSTGEFYFLLRASCFLARSDRAEALFRQNVPYATVPADSEKFLTVTIRECPLIYPVFCQWPNYLSRVMQFVYLPNTHARHMLYTEGGDNMFAELRSRILDKTMTRDLFDLWLCRWILNIAGFRGHENPVGSVYLTRKTARHLRLLINELNIFYSNPNHDVLKGYLSRRGAELGVTSKYLSHLGALMRLSTKKEGEALQQWFDSLPPARRQALEEQYAASVKTMTMTPTYEPAVLDNLLALGCSIAETVDIYSTITSKAFAQHHQEVPLSFREAARKENLLPLIEAYRANQTLELTLTFAANGSFVPSLAPKRTFACVVS